MLTVIRLIAAHEKLTFTMAEAEVSLESVFQSPRGVKPSPRSSLTLSNSAAAAVVGVPQGRTFKEFLSSITRGLSRLSAICNVEDPSTLSIADCNFSSARELLRVLVKTLNNSTLVLSDDEMAVKERINKATAEYARVTTGLIAGLEAFLLTCPSTTTSNATGASPNSTRMYNAEQAKQLRAKIDLARGKWIDITHQLVSALKDAAAQRPNGTTNAPPSITPVATSTSPSFGGRSMSFAN